VQDGKDAETLLEQETMSFLPARSMRLPATTLEQARHLAPRRRQTTLEVIKR